MAVDGPPVVNFFDHFYFYQNWGGSVQYLAFEQRLQHLREQADLVFVGWHNVELFSVPILRRLFPYMLMVQWWTEMLEWQLSISYRRHGCTSITPDGRRMKGMYNRGLTTLLRSGSSFS